MRSGAETNVADSAPFLAPNALRTRAALNLLHGIAFVTWCIGGKKQMSRNTAYWAATALVATEALSAAIGYLTGADWAVENFRHVGYPQQLRVLLGIAKLSGAIVLLVPRLPTLKEWAYAGFTFMWIAATVAHYLAGDGALVVLPPALIGLLAVSYIMRATDRRGSAKAPLAGSLDGVVAKASGVQLDRAGQVKVSSATRSTAGETSPWPSRNAT
jgi:hypothetical protein